MENNRCHNDDCKAVPCKCGPEGYPGWQMLTVRENNKNLQSEEDVLIKEVEILLRRPLPTPDIIPTMEHINYERSLKKEELLAQKINSYNVNNEWLYERRNERKLLKKLVEIVKSKNIK